MPENPAEPLPRWGIFNDDTDVVTDDYLAASAAFSLSVTSIGGGTVVSAGNWDIILAMPEDAKRVLLNCRWTHTVTTTNGAFTDVSSSYNVDESVFSPAAVTDLAFSAAPDAGGSTAQDYTVEWTRGGAQTEWRGSREEFEAAPPTAATNYCRWQMFTSAQSLGEHITTSVLTHTATIVEIELENGHIYTPAELVPDAYWIGDGHDVPVPELAALVPQPATSGVKVTRRSHDQAAPLLDEFKYLELLYSGLGSVAEYQAVLTAFGVLSAMQNEITITARDATLGWVRFNGTAVRPQMGTDINWSRHLPRDIVILVKELGLSA